MQTNNITVTNKFLNVELGQASGTFLRIMGTNDGGIASQIDDTNLTNTSDISFEITYQIA